MLVDSRNFLELKFPSVAKILSSSELSVDSELQVLDAANFWLKYNITERGKFTPSLLLKIRLWLLSDHALKDILFKTSFFKGNKDCIAIINYVLQNKEYFLKNISESFHKSRYCGQDKFDIILCGGYGKTCEKSVLGIDLKNLDNFKVLPDLNKEREMSRTVCVKDQVYVLGGADANLEYLNFAEKYSTAAIAWETVPSMRVADARSFDACSFMDNIYVMGHGYNRCMEFNKNNQKWKNVAEMKEKRIYLSVAVFEGRIVASGGWNIDNGTLNTVEAYDHVADSWSYMPNMIQRRDSHKSVAIRNKLFIVGSFDVNGEVFDSTSKKFVFIKKTPAASFLRDYRDPTEIVSIGSQIVVFADLRDTILFYDVDNDEWAEKFCERRKYISNFSCTKVPQV